MVKDKSVRPQMIKIWVDDEREMPEDYKDLEVLMTMIIKEKNK